MNEALVAAEDLLIESLAEAGREPEQHGTFAVWLFVRTCSGVLPPQPLSGRAHQRRLQTMVRRVARLSLPSPLRRALAGGIREVAAGVPQSAALALQQLVTPARETLGPRAGDAVALAARAARDAVRQAKG